MNNKTPILNNNPVLLQLFKPHPALRHIVDYIMVSSSRISLSEPLPVTPFPPLSQQALHFYVHDPISVQVLGEKEFTVAPKSIIIGPQLIRVNLKLGHDTLLVRVAFQPGGLHRLVKFVMHEILDYACDSSLVFGNIINEIHEKLNEANNALEMKNVVEAFLMKKVSYDSSSFTESIKYLVANSDNISIGELAGKTGLSTRQFERKCNAYIGFSPKLFLRIDRFSKAYRLRENYPKLTWTAIAYQCGYYDQMHLIRDFKEFAGVTPTFIERELSSTPFRLQAYISL